MRLSQAWVTGSPLWFPLNVGEPRTFRQGAVVLANAIGEVADTRRAYGEARMKAFGQVEGLWFACTYTMRGGVTRIPGVQRIREKEVRRWLKDE